MSRFGFLFVIFFLFGTVLYAQDSTGKLAFEEVVLSDSMTTETLFKNAVRWLKNIEREPKAEYGLSTRDSINGKLEGYSSFNVYAETGVLKKKSGRVRYDFVLEMKDGKYRYRFFNFVYHYVSNDRYHKIFETGKTKAMDESNASGWQKLWDKYQRDTRSEMEQTIRILKKGMTYAPPAAPEKPAPKAEW